jgi:hypothetical protein
MIAFVALGAFAAPAWAEGAASSIPRADEAICAAIVTAARSVGKAPQYRSVLVATWPTRKRPIEREQIVIGDTVYATSAGGRWMKLPVTASDRESLAAGLERYPPHHCEAVDQVLEGVPLRVYAYRQDVSGSDSATNRLWVGGDDGLPRRFESQEGATRVVVTLEYQDVTPPNIH